MRHRSVFLFFFLGMLQLPARTSMKIGGFKSSISKLLGLPANTQLCILSIARASLAAHPCRPLLRRVARACWSNLLQQLAISPDRTIYPFGLQKGVQEWLAIDWLRSCLNLMLRTASLTPRGNWCCRLWPTG